MVIQQYFWLIFAGVALATATILHRREQHTWALFTLTIGGLFVYLFAARLCPYLNTWDEQFHALVARNLMNHPLTPTLYEDNIVGCHDYSSWIGANVWLHKQPLFLWQIALCFKLLGVSEFTLRLPSVILCTLLIPLVHQLAKRLTGNMQIAFIAAVATASSWFLIRLTSGIECTDHNDVCFIFYVTASLWAFVEYLYRDRKSWIWVALIGLFAGAAILTKWLTGLLVFLCWGIYLLAEHKLDFRSWHIGHFLAALGITLLVVAPWQIYTFVMFPEMAQQEMLYNFKHASAAVENHSGPFWYPLIILPLQYFGHGFRGQTTSFEWNFHAILCYLVLALGFFLLLKKLKKSSLRWAIAGTTLFVLIFFGFASTKMPAFTFILCSFGFISIACTLNWLLQLLCKWLRNRQLQTVFFTLCILLTAYYQLNYPHYFQNTLKVSRQHLIDNKNTFLSWQQKLPQGCYVFNVNGYDVEHFSWTAATYATFYSERQCYYDLPPLEALYRLQRSGTPVAIIHNIWLPPEYAADTLLIHINDPIWY